MRVALMPDGEDPDTLLRKAGPAAVRKAVEGGLSPLDFAMGQLEARHGTDEEAFWSAAIARLAAAPAGLDVERHLDRLSGLYPGLRDPVAARRRLEAMIAERRPVPPKPERPTRPDRRPGPPSEPPAPDAPPGEPMPALGERLNRIEATLFQAFYVPEFRHTAWMFARMEPLFMTGAGVALSRAIKAAFPEGPPEGKPAVWLARLPDREATTMADLNDRLLPEPIGLSDEALSAICADARAASSTEELGLPGPAKPSSSARQSSGPAFRRRGSVRLGCDFRLSFEPLGTPQPRGFSLSKSGRTAR